MDDPSRRRRQNEPPVHQASNPRYPPQAPSPRNSSLTTPASERYRLAQLNTTSPSTPRSMGVAGNYSSYYQEPQAAFSTPNMSATAMTYGSEYGSDTRAQGQGFGSYNAGMIMYNVAHPGTQTPVYDAQQFAQRQQAAMQMMAPDVASTYFSSEAGATAAPGIQHSAQGSSASSGVYQQHTVPLNYAGSMSSVNTMQQQPPTCTSAAVSEDHDYHDAAIAEKWVNYQRQLGAVFQDVKNGSLERASETLLSLSNWLLTQVADLARRQPKLLTAGIGLSQDDATLHDERIKLWNDFNHAWLALLFQQKTMMESGQQLSESQRLMPEETLNKMGDELIRLCDGIERHGLVDYQYGVWEEQIESSGYCRLRFRGQELIPGRSSRRLPRPLRVLQRHWGGRPGAALKVAYALIYCHFGGRHLYNQTLYGQIRAVQWSTSWHGIFASERAAFLITHPRLGSWGPVHTASGMGMGMGMGMGIEASVEARRRRDEARDNNYYSAFGRGHPQVAGLAWLLAA
ncbi:hypothetical protein TOPH_01733 [Tolypocladium ophioglossoides CBS 100239]|uniref:Uncharacterized protein n=1 Tax=Tolypocladium ophioglossoides (strain CBS 100239) TaxID=1163406 RepID=A0A0L0NI93_TOLOC|nr:hypothetical protein TOPH_01733 [Tolypocladium ophioglossoides CBS 100239]